MVLASYIFFTILVLILLISISGQRVDIPLTNWKCARNDAIQEKIPPSDFTSVDWLPAIVPGSVLTSLLAAGKFGFSDPYYEDNLKLIPDINTTNREYYTYWFVNNFSSSINPGYRYWLHLRGINYIADVYLNGQKIQPIGDANCRANAVEGMWMRHLFEITNNMANNDQHILAILVHPVLNPGAPGGQGGTHEIAKDVSAQFTAGWDWIQASPDRVTGIWDKISVFRTGSLLLRYPHIKTTGITDTLIIVKVEVYNPGLTIEGTIAYELDGKVYELQKYLFPQGSSEIELPSATIASPRLWWPHGYGPQELYTLCIHLSVSHSTSSKDEICVTFGIRDIRQELDPSTQGRKFYVNEIPIFLRGGNWITTDQFFRFSTDSQRYMDEVRMHKEMNMNMIRVWGGGLAERPEFYAATDKLGLLVMQDFWMSGDNNGRWAGDYDWPEDHSLYIRSVQDTIRMLRNHPSLFFWCGGNELSPPEKNPPPDIASALEEAVRTLDGTRFYIQSSMGAGGPDYVLAPADGPYQINEPRFFHNVKSDAGGFNPELGYQGGLPVVESMKRMMSAESLAEFPKEGQGESEVSEMWKYHKFLTYTTPEHQDAVYRYGRDISSITEYCEQAQLANYMHYRGMMEGFSAHMWEWYTGYLIWKSQGPWPGLRGHLYDWYLDQTSAVFGVKHALEMVHVQLNFPGETGLQLCVVNVNDEDLNNVQIILDVVDATGQYVMREVYDYNNIPGSTVFKGDDIPWPSLLGTDHMGFFKLQLLNNNGELISQNNYWQSIPSKPQDYADDLRLLKEQIANLNVEIIPNHSITEYRYKVILSLSSISPVIAFFIRLSTEKAVTTNNHIKTDQRVLPTWYSDNFVTLFPSDEIEIVISCKKSAAGNVPPNIKVEGWNVDSQIYSGKDLSHKERFEMIKLLLQQ